MVLLIIFALLLTSFFIHVIWWRLKTPAHTTRTLLFIFTTIPLIFLCLDILLGWDFLLSGFDFFRIALLYASCSLVYIILHSAIENQSPTLAILGYLIKRGDEGCTDNELECYIDPAGEVQSRVNAMQQVGWLICEENRCRLSKRGKRITSIFFFGSIVFGLNMGG